MHTPLEFTLRQYRTGEIAQFLFNACQIVQQHNPPGTPGYDDIKAKLEPVKAVSSLMDKALGIDRGSETTEVIQALDTTRDSDLSGITTVCKGLRLNPDDTVAQAAGLLLDTIMRYGYINDLSYQEQTAKLRALISEIEKDTDLQQAVSALPFVGDWLLHLKDSNNNFDLQYMKRIAETAALPEDNATSLRIPAANAWTELQRMINAYAVISGNGLYDSLTGELSGLIDKYRNLRAQREGRRKAGDKE